MVSSHQQRIRYRGAAISVLTNSVLILFLSFGGITETKAFSCSSFSSLSSVLTTRARSNTKSSSTKKIDSRINLIPVTDSNYRELFSGEKYLLLDACAQWCGPCKMIEPLLVQCADDWKDTVVVGKFDVDDANDKSRDLKVELILQGAMPQALPALILIHNNKVLDTWKGVISQVELQEMLEKSVVGKKANVQTSGKGQNKFFESMYDVASETSRPFRGIRLIND
eukprot:jgi/Psemu1/325658/estExt_fgenesh1_pg.C_2640013